MSAAESFIDVMGELSEQSDNSRSVGRIFGLLTLSPEPVSFSDLATELGLSRGGVSQNTQRLIQMGLVEKVAGASARESYYRCAAGNLYRTIVAQQLERNERVIRAYDQVVQDQTIADAVRRRIARQRLQLKAVNALVAHHLDLLEAFEEQDQGESS